MFTGIVTATGTIAQIEPRESSHRLTIKTALDLSDAQLGESIAVNGCCLTVVALIDGGFSVDVAKESLAVTTLGQLEEGGTVNLERALRMSDRLGGHWVQGHVDGIGTLEKREPHSEGELWRVKFPAALAKYIVKKGSITVDGVSLTVNAVEPQVFEIFLIPHTLQMSTLGQRHAGDRLNLEVDILAKYIETLLASGR
jgi:riboflavin synthase